MATVRPNRLAGETSPYLLQHAHNPVDWYPWGSEALERAAASDRPIFLSVGYAACHWCHVMERESFEDEATAAVLNAGFVPVKVDREERPDIDSVYMAAVQAMTGAGGWPMSVFLTPDGRPFYGGTYYPAEPRYGVPSFHMILRGVAEAWRDRRTELEAAADRLAAELRRRGDLPAETEAVPAAAESSGAATSTGGPTGDVPGSAVGQRGTVRGLSPLRLQLPARPGPGQTTVGPAVALLVDGFDHDRGGWGGPPRFPQPALIELLLRRASGIGDDRARAAALRALDVMAAGGIRDHLGGGFHRYATDTNWLVPHFEKMLYDNAQLARTYLHAFGLTGEPRYRDVAESTLDYLARDLLAADELFASSEDADTDGVEGAPYAWTPAEVEAALAEGRRMTDLGPNRGGRIGDPTGLEAAVFCSAYGVTESGNWEGRTILSRVLDDRAVAQLHGITPVRVAEVLASARAVLLDRRRARPRPAIDDKAVAAWNGLALAAFAEAVPLLGRPEDLATAEALAGAALRLLRGSDGRLARSYRAGRTSGSGGLDDYACLADGLLALYGATFEERWLTAARDLMDAVDRHFADPAGGWFDTPDDAERLLLRPQDIQDGATPSGGAAAAAVAMKLAELTGEERLRVMAERALRRVEPLAAKYPRAFGAWLCALDFAASPIAQVAIVGDLAARSTQALVEVARAGYQPHRVVAVGDSETTTVELIQGRFRLRGLPTAFVCRDFACRQPVTEPAALAAELA
jgi:uncharacterized protein